MSKQVVHFLNNFFGDGWGCAEVNAPCGAYMLSGMTMRRKFTNHKSDVTCKNCLKAIAKGQGE